MTNYLGPSTLKKLTALPNDDANDGWMYPGVEITSLDDTVVTYEEYVKYRDTEMAYHLGPGFPSGPVYKTVTRPAQNGDVTRYKDSLYQFDGEKWVEKSQFDGEKWKKVLD